MDTIMAELLDRLASFLASRDDLLLGIVYGSQVEGTARPDSDVDVAVLAALQLALEEVCRRPVDLRDLRRLQGLIRHRVLTHGKVLLNRDATLLGELMVASLDWVTDIWPGVQSGIRRDLEAFVDGR